MLDLGFDAGACDPGRAAGGRREQQRRDGGAEARTVVGGGVEREPGQAVSAGVHGAVRVLDVGAGRTHRGEVAVDQPISERVPARHRDDGRAHTGEHRGAEAHRGADSRSEMVGDRAARQCGGVDGEASFGGEGGVRAECAGDVDAHAGVGDGGDVAQVNGLGG
nr:hypothetical protein [Marinitenerispora sediminis]